MMRYLLGSSEVRGVDPAERYELAVIRHCLDLCSTSIIEGDVELTLNETEIVAVMSSFSPSSTLRVHTH